ncbi:MAG: hypothetical protein AAF849_23150, partial [Bacteroidota bacterium]
SCGGSGSNGKVISTHIKANYIYLKDNIIFDCNDGMHLTSDIANPKIFVENNVLSNIHNYTNHEKKSCAFRLGVNVNLIGNTIENVDYAIVCNSKNIDNIVLQRNIIAKVKFENRIPKRVLFQEEGNQWYSVSRNPSLKISSYVGKWTKIKQF